MFVEDAEAVDPRKMLLRLKGERIDGKKMCFCTHLESTFASRTTIFRACTGDGFRLSGYADACRVFVILAIGGSVLVPLDFAFFDRAVLRVPKEHDIRAFLKRKESEAEAAWAAEKEDLKELRDHLRKREQQLVELEAGFQTTRETKAEGYFESHQEVGQEPTLA